MNRVRSRLTTGVTTTRLVLEARRSARPLVVIAIGVAAALGSAFYVFENVGKAIYTPTREVGFIVSDASGVIGGGRQQLEFKGIPAGRIDGSTLKHGQAEIDGSIYASFGPIYRDAEVTLRPATPLQDMVIDILDRGTPSSGVATTNNPVPLKNTSTSIQPGDVLDTFHPEVRTQLATTLRDLGGGLNGQGAALQRAFVELVPFLREAAKLTGALSQRGQLTRELVHNAGVLTAALDERQQQLTDFIGQTGTTMRALQSDAPGLSATLQQLPPTLDGLRRSFAVVRSDLPDVNSALTSLGPVADELPASLKAVQTLSNRTLPAVQALQAPVRQLVPLSQALRPLAENLQGAVTRLSSQVVSINTITKSVAGCAVAIQGFFQWTPSVTKFWTPTGPGVRGDFGFGADNAEVIKDPNVRPSPTCAPGGPAGGTPGPTLPAEPGQ